jgi:hypothetical protein
MMKDLPTQLTKAQMAALLDAVKKNPEFALQQAFKFGISIGLGQAAAIATKRAAEILDYEAEMLREDSAPHGNWSGDDEAKADYDERKLLVKLLRGLA